MVLGNVFSGKLSSRFSPLRIAATTDLVIVASLLALFAFGELKTASLVMDSCAAPGCLRSAPLQILLLQNAKGGEMLGPQADKWRLTSAAQLARISVE